jgi:peptide/nickel transport system ATP-binding protein
MGVVLITHDLTAVRQFADHVHVMQHGEVREDGPTEQVFSAPQNPYTRRLLASDPKGVANPLTGPAETVLEAQGVRVGYRLRKGGALRGVYRPLVAVDGLAIDLKRGETLGLVGESGSGKTTFGQALLRLIRTARRCGPIAAVFQDPLSSLNPRMSVRQIIEEGLVVNRIGAPTATSGSRGCSRRCVTACPTTSTPAFRTSFRAGNASASRSPGPSRSSRSSSCSTSRPRRWTCRSRRRS